MSATQILKLLPQSEEMIVKLHQRQQERYRRALARERQEAAKWGTGGFRRVRMPDGTQMHFRIPRLSYIMWQRKLGEECWSDPGFVHDYLRDNPQFRVKNEAAKPLFGWTPSSKYSQAYRRMKAPTKATKPAELPKGTILAANGRPV